MSRRSLFVAVGVPLLVLGLGGILLLMLRYEPSHYRQAVVAPEERPRLTKDFLRAFSNFWNATQSSDSIWEARFTDEQINAFIQAGQADTFFPEGISEPRVVFEAERMRLAFRYKSGLINTIISISLKIWLPGAESNLMAMRLEHIDAGMVPFSAQWLLERISEVARNNGIEVSWFRHEGYPVALIRFQADQARPTLQLEDVRFEQGSITIHGRSREGQPGLAVGSP
jgi:hypothetical protein